jgi:hypothetical protein
MFLIMLGVFSFLNLLDLLLTLFLLNLFGSEVESNPIARACYCCNGALGISLLKLATTSIAIYILCFLYKVRPLIACRLGVFACGLMTFIVAWNFYICVLVLYD